MARILNIDIPENKRTCIALTKIYGIGRPKALEIVQKLNIDVNLKVKDLTEEQLSAIRQELTNETTEGELRRNVGYSIKRLMEIGCYRGLRHRKGLPVRGQSTKRNSRTRKGPRKTIANKKKVSQKT